MLDEKAKQKIKTDLQAIQNQITQFETEVSKMKRAGIDAIVQETALQSMKDQYQKLKEVYG